ncbi:hypothetical protein [Vibrio aestuarianus]|uniref:hypothetical protein n=1 Tax=Vibrio aestuarianus TaxID=28171 RepID=UPI00237C7377|nr:hypothetical protein [Vibrio aestuarianus]MDE1265818.1 hypothetical protein [Vibrio aestuarianus]MDE1297924.1 hypothetical protein [Vibrio aestuarianus]
MLLFVDNDVVIKLAEYELLTSLHGIVSKSGHRIHVLESLAYVAGLNNVKRAQKVFSTDSSIEQIKEFLDTVELARINKLSTMTLINSINEPNLDEGELTLLGCAIESDMAGFCSGDKRAIQAVNDLASIKTLSLENCIIIILEHTLKLLITAFGAGVLQQVICKPNVDKAVRLCFQGATADNLDQTILALESYINDLKNKCQSLAFVELTDF